VQLFSEELRREIKLLATRLEAVGKEVHIMPMSELLWSALEKVYQKDDEEGLEAVIELENERGYVEAQQQVTTYLSSRVWIPLWDLLAERLTAISPDNPVVFLTVLQRCRLEFSTCRCEVCNVVVQSPIEKACHHSLLFIAS
jgi:hypothetical protein